MSLLSAVFVGSHSRSVTFAHIARHLQMSGVRVFFIMPGAKFRIKYLTDMGFNKDDILNLADIDKSYDPSAVAKMETFSQVTASYMIMSDRLLKKKQGKEALGYLGGVFKSVSKFLTDNNIDVVFSEATWAYEMSICAACSGCGVEFIVPHTVRIPNGRFGFFRGIFQNELVRIGKKSSIMPLPSKFQAEHAPLQPKLISIQHTKSFFRHLHRYIVRSAKDETEQDFFELISERFLRAYNIKRSGFVSMYHVPDREYVFLPLHVAYEASLDVLGGFWQNQLELIRNIARSLPNGIVLAVKEHAAGIGRRDYKFFRETSKLHNVVNISPFADSSVLIRNARAVVSVSGSACYEASFAGVGSVVFSDVFFGALPTVFRCRSAEDIGSVLADAVSVKPDRHALSEFLAEITANSYEGCVESAEVAPNAVEEENARKAAQAFMEVMKHYSSSEKPLYAASMSSR